MNRASFTFVARLALITLLGGCGDSGPVCGFGSVERDGVCVPAISACGAGSVLQDGTCVPTAELCAPGTTWTGGRCQPQATGCGAGTHAEGGSCVPDASAPPDLWGPDSANDVVALTLPAAGASLVLGGTISTPVDLDGDSYVDADWDTFSFVGQAGDYLRLAAASDGALLPAYMITSATTDGGWPVYMRLCLEPNAGSCVRELYLPADDTYYLSLSDYVHVWSTFFGQYPLPIGGDAFTYRARIENLGAPTPTAVSALPVVASGEYAQGALQFWAVPAGLASQTLRVVSSGQVEAGVHNQVYGALLAFTGAGALVGAVESYDADARFDLLLDTHAAQALLVVQDFVAAFGAERRWATTLSAVDPLECTAQSCAVTGADDESLLWAWDLDAGDLVAIALSVDAASVGSASATLVDEQLAPLVGPLLVDRSRPQLLFHYAATAARVMLWLETAVDNPPSAYAVSATHAPTPALIDRVPTLSVPAIDLPAPELEDAAVAHLGGAAGQVALIADFAVLGAWDAPVAELLTPTRELLGPAVDGLERFTPTTLAPLLARLPDSGDALHWVRGVGAGVAGKSYDATLELHTPVALGVLGASAVERLGETFSADSAFAFYTLTATAWQGVDLTVTPAVGSGMQAELWALAIGRQYDSGGELYWDANTLSHQLGRIAAASATAVEEPLTLSFAWPDSGAELLVAVRDLAGGGGAFDLRAAARLSPANDLCAGATALALAGGSAGTNGDLIGAAHDLPALLSCSGVWCYGPDQFYSVTLAAGDQLTATLDADAFNGVLYLLGDCAATSCLGGAAQGDPRTVSYTVPAGGDGVYTLAVCGRQRTSTGDYALQVTVE